MPHFDRPSTTQTTLDFYRLTTEVQLAIYNGVVLSWREKVIAQRSASFQPASVVRQKGVNEHVQVCSANEHFLVVGNISHFWKYGNITQAILLL